MGSARPRTGPAHHVPDALRVDMSFGWSKYNEYAAIDPQELVVGGNYDGTLLWKRRQPEFQFDLRQALRQLQRPHFARRFKKNADIPLFRRALSAGHHLRPGHDHGSKVGPLDLGRRLHPVGTFSR